MSLCEALRDWVWEGDLEHVDGGEDGDPVGVMLGGTSLWQVEPPGHQPRLRQDKHENQVAHLPPRPLQQWPPASCWHIDAVRQHPLIFWGLWSTGGTPGSLGCPWRFAPASQRRAGGLAVQRTLGAGILLWGCPPAAKPESSQGPCPWSGEWGADSLRSCPGSRVAVFSFRLCDVSWGRARTRGKAGSDSIA